MGHQEVRKGSCATMGYLSFALLVGMAMAIPNLPNKPEKGKPDPEYSPPMSEEPKNPGKPLNETDFSRASKLPNIPAPLTALKLMKIMEDGELKGARSTDDKQTQPMKKNKKWPRTNYSPLAKRHCSLCG